MLQYAIYILNIDFYRILLAGFYFPRKLARLVSCILYAINRKAYYWIWIQNFMQWWIHNVTLERVHSSWKNGGKYIFWKRANRVAVFNGKTNKKTNENVLEFKYILWTQSGHINNCHHWQLWTFWENILFTVCL